MDAGYGWWAWKCGRWEWGRQVGWQPQGSPRDPFLLHGNAYPCGRQLGTCKSHPWDSGVLLHPNTLKHPMKHMEDPWQFQQLWCSRSVPLHPGAISAVSLRGHPPHGKGMHPSGSPASRFEHPTPCSLLPAPAPADGMAPGASVAAWPQCEASKWISRAPLTFLLPSL